MQSAFREKFSHTMAVWGLLDGGSVMVRRMRVFAVASETGRGGASVAVAVAACFSVALMTWNPCEKDGVFPVV